MSALLATANPRRIKATHRRRWKCTAAHRVYANNNPYRFKDPDGRTARAGFNDDWIKDAAKSVATFFGRQASDSGSERSRYSSEAAKLEPGDSAGRAALKAESRANTPSVVRAVVGAARPSTDAKAGSGGRANASNVKANAGGAMLKTGGRVLIAAAVVGQAHEIATSAEPARDVAGAGGMTIGAIGGGEGGAAVGGAIGFALGGPPGAAVGAIIGGLGGSAAGGSAGEHAAEAVYDKSTQ